MVSLQDLVTLAKAGWTPKQTKEILEMIETSPRVKEAEPEKLKDVEINKEEEPIAKPEKVEEVDPLEQLKNILEE
jgi:hypothetical protein